MLAVSVHHVGSCSDYVPQRAIGSDIVNARLAIGPLLVEQSGSAETLEFLTDSSPSAKRDRWLRLEDPALRVGEEPQKQRQAARPAKQIVADACGIHGCVRGQVT